MRTWLIAARQSPDFAVKILAQLTPEARAEVSRVWCSMQRPELGLARRPGLVKAAQRSAARRAA